MQPRYRGCLPWKKGSRLKIIEATSFVSPRRIPQLADADELMRGLRRRPGVRYPVLVPNERGFERALTAGADELAIFVSATESFAQQNLGTTLDGAIEMAAPVVAARRIAPAAAWAAAWPVARAASAAAPTTRPSASAAW